MAIKGWYKVGECFRKGKLVRGLFPTDRYSDDCLHETSLDTLLRVSATRPRSRKHNSLYWVLCKLIADNSSYTKDQIHQLFKHAVGLTQKVTLRSGEEVTLYGSTAFENLDQAEFIAFFESVQVFISTELIPGIQAEDLKREVIETARIDLPT